VTADGVKADGVNDLGELVRVEGGLATLTRVFGDLQLAEDALHDAVVVALERWPVDGVPANPAAWLTVAGRNKAIDRLRREARRTEKEQAAMRDATPPDPEPLGDSTLDDDTLRLIFTCCHPALAPEARVALSLRTLCGLSTVEIARAFLISEPTMAQRIVRTKHKIATAHIPYRIPADHELPERLPAVLAVVYVIFTEGHSASTGDQLVRVDLCDEAIRLARVLATLLPDEPEVLGLLGLLLLTDARRATRIDDVGDLVLLEDQDRGRWDAGQVAEGATLVEEALRRSAGRPGPYALQAAIAACHATAPTYRATDWLEIARLYEYLEAVQPGPVVRLNRAVAVAEVDGPESALRLVDGIEGLERFHRYHVVRAELLRRADRDVEAVAAYRAALALEPSEPEARHLARRLAELG
jgi:RNA polymerase sigma-70 factor (ECF subfamily)